MICWLSVDGHVSPPGQTLSMTVFSHQVARAIGHNKRFPNLYLTHLAFWGSNCLNKIRNKVSCRIHWADDPDLSPRIIWVEKSLISIYPHKQSHVWRFDDQMPWGFGFLSFIRTGRFALAGLFSSRRRSKTWPSLHCVSGGFHAFADPYLFFS